MTVAGDWGRRPQMDPVCGFLDFSFVGSESVPGYYTFLLQDVPDDLDDICEIWVWVEDSVGNAQTKALGELVTNDSNEEVFEPMNVVFDNTALVAADVLDVSGMKHLRFPYGAAQTGGVPSQYLTGLDVDAQTDLQGEMANPVKSADGRDLQKALTVLSRAQDLELNLRKSKLIVMQFLLI